MHVHAVHGTKVGPSTVEIVLYIYTYNFILSQTKTVFDHEGHIIFQVVDIPCIYSTSIYMYIHNQTPPKLECNISAFKVNHFFFKVLNHILDLSPEQASQPNVC